MNEKAFDNSFNPKNVLSLSVSSLYDLPSPVGSEEFLNSKHMDTSLSMKSFLQEGKISLAPLNTVLNKRLDLQTQIDLTPPFQTILIPPKQVSIDSLIITKPIVLKGSSPMSALVVTGAIRISLEGSTKDAFNFKKVFGVQSPRPGFVILS